MKIKSKVGLALGAVLMLVAPWLCCGAFDCLRPEYQLAGLLSGVMLGGAGFAFAASSVESQ